MIIRRDVKFDENILACDPNSMFVSSFLPKFYVSDPILVYSLDKNNENENPALLSHLPSLDSIEHELSLVPSLPKWVHSTQEAVSNVTSDPTY
jgi:hypothetical protein